MARDPHDKRSLEIPPSLLGREKREETLDDLPPPSEEAIADAVAGLSPEEAQVYSILGGTGNGSKRKKPPLVFEVQGPLTTKDLQDLEDLKVDGRAKASNVQLQKVRSIHHQMAQYLAQGYKIHEVSVLLGVGAQRIVALKQDPAFKELLKIYEDKQQAVAVSILERISTVALLGLEEVQDRLLDEPDLLTNPQLTRLVELALDRCGHGPGGQSQNKDQGVLTADEVSKIKEEVRASEKTVIREREMTPSEGENEGEYIPANEESHNGGDSED